MKTSTDLEEDPHVKTDADVKTDAGAAVVVGGAASARFWPMVREALRGSRRDLTTMPLGRAVFLLAIRWCWRW